MTTRLSRSLPGLVGRNRQDWLQPLQQVQTSDHKPVCSRHTIELEEVAGPVVMDGSARVELVLTNLHGNRLTAMDKNGKSDPYVKFSGLRLLGQQEPKTKVISATVDPRWENSAVRGARGSC